MPESYRLMAVGCLSVVQKLCQKCYDIVIGVTSSIDCPRGKIQKPSMLSLRVTICSTEVDTASTCLNAILSQRND